MNSLIGQHLDVECVMPQPEIVRNTNPSDNLDRTEYIEEEEEDFE